MIIGIDGNEANVSNRVGSGQYAFEVIKNLLAIDKKNNYRIDLKKRPLPDFPKENQKLKYLVFGPKKFWTQIVLPAKLYFDKPRPDVFFSPTHYAPRFSPVPSIITIFDLSFIHYPEMFRKSDLYQLQNWTAYSVKKAARIITISANSKQDIVKFYKVSQDKVVVIYPGVNKNFKPQPQEKIKKIKIKYQIGTNYILYLGTLQPRKNLIRLIEVFKNLKLKSDSLKLVIAGKKGWQYGEIFQKVSELKLDDKVIFTDFVPPQDLPALYSGAQVFVNLSLWEGFGIPVLEAMACGVPVVVSKTSSLPEVVGDSGILVDPEKIEDISAGLAKVLSLTQGQRRTLIEKGIAQSKKFSWEKSAREILKILESVVS